MDEVDGFVEYFEFVGLHLKLNGNEGLIGDAFADLNLLHLL